MQSLLSIAVDPDRSRGLWFYIDAVRHIFDESPHDEPHPDWISVKVARAGNPAYRNREAELWALRSGEIVALGTDVAKLSTIERNINKQLIAECLLVDWRNIEELGDYSHEKSTELISDPKYDKLAVFVWRCANRVSAFEQKHEEAILGN